jgi:hypothetical protein
MLPAVGKQEVWHRSENRSYYDFYPFVSTCTYVRNKNFRRRYPSYYRNVYDLINQKLGHRCSLPSANKKCGTGLKIGVIHSASSVQAPYQKSNQVEISFYGLSNCRTKELSDHNYALEVKVLINN